MTDNFLFTPGAGATGAADNVGGVLYQKVKLNGGVDGVSTPIEAGRQADAVSLPVALSTENVALVGGLTETAPASDTASSGLNGRLQRVAQRISSLIALIPAALGANGGFKVEGVASGTAVPVSGTVTINAVPAGTNNIGDVDVLSLPALPAGANNIGDVDVLSLPALPAGTNNIGDVDVLSLPATPAGANIIGKISVVDSTGDSVMDDTNNAVRVNLVAGSGAVTTNIYNGKTPVTTAGTRVVLASSQSIKSVTIKALAANTGIIYVGNSTVTSSNGFALAAGETISYDIANLVTTYIDASVNGEGVTYIGID